ncbi:MAG: Tat pathway signal protein [Verrucomicrobiota bacterium]
MSARPSNKPSLIWGNLVHLSMNMWFDCGLKNLPLKRRIRDFHYQPYLRFDFKLWHDLIPAMKNTGLNMVVLDLGDAVHYKSHPEIAVKNALPPKRLREELQRLRDHGLEPIPKLNFATTHDTWLGSYSRMISTKTYYQVCRDLIKEVTDLFDGPRFFHLGMDEETAVNQIYQQFAAIRQFDLWWHDLFFLFNEVRRNGARPWIWSDYEWYHTQDFYKHMPKYVLQSNWWYYTKLNPKTTLVRCNPQDHDMDKLLKLKPVQAYISLEKHGYDQVLTGSNVSRPDSMAETAAFAITHIKRKRMYGFLMTTWRAMLAENRKLHFEAIAQVGQAKKQFTK